MMKTDSSRSLWTSERHRHPISSQTELKPRHRLHYHTADEDLPPTIHQPPQKLPPKGLPQPPPLHSPIKRPRPFD